MTKEKLRNGLLKFSYGISSPIDEYQEKQLDHLGNSAYLILTLVTPFLLFVAVALALVTTYQIAFWFAIISLFALFIIVSWYFYIVAVRQGVLVNEVDSSELKGKRKIAIRRGIITGIIFALIECLTLVIIYQNYSLNWNIITVLTVFIGSLLVGLIAGTLTGVIAWKNLKKFNG
ncbi:MAG: DUF3278 domain-containing protein [Limosilactobacillus sp.]|jgi:phosphatidylglycerophosphate synthase|uniref:DUF3278 domain-containing protein n=1 Tax=Limosilactobacillus sp. TaxID=2773925 RepID=UPI0025B98584|nr:DUF3278 domain-containing protein [Limosilactobacillus sp.]MCI1975425.1 DUF3278 domain-containing protein [Limosilactobacillus sp.]MCI2030356.1 DUF3278 domain-containing protein [Limosilactobacillus sp.]